MPPISSESSDRLDLPYLMPAQAQKHVTHNAALQQLDLVVQLVMETIAAETPPADPVAGQVFALGAGPTGAWAGQGGRLAAWSDGAWLFLDPAEGWRAWLRETDQLVVWQEGAWVSPDSEIRARLGIATSPDAQNPLAVAGPATLLTHAGAGHQLKINKAAVGETASLLFQSGWTGHAEMGLAGETAFSLKVSADGTSWVEAIRADPASGHLSGAAVQATAYDTTAGRLMRADWGYGPGNLLGSVALSGGQPTGAVLEQGATADGAWLRLADGTQMVWASRSAGSVWTFPQAFSAAPVLSLTSTESAARMVAATTLSASAVTPISYDPTGTAQTGDGLSCLAVGRWD
ncbi:DUF2793 domain-containing protein [Phaeobacter sp. B1627]|uniref:DUF2793 domain-containing protein n=1 Tax=Phaeobacter sp. B1627 TaxID=2583809 RepID=UPI00111BB4B4|nr:DUF2793 domain-containing protein [Phaeobacter sp. B1627]TNJ40954.1 DUF2793 domain-containing protein [Phaeobacter sp. B1627]